MPRPSVIFLTFAGFWAPSTVATGLSRLITGALQSLDGHEQGVAVLPSVVHHDVDMGVPVRDVVLALLGQTVGSGAADQGHQLTTSAQQPLEDLGGDRAEVVADQREVALDDPEHVAGFAGAGHRDRLTRRDRDGTVP